MKKERSSVCRDANLGGDYARDSHRGGYGPKRR
jgi:hypothetical protein